MSDVLTAQCGTCGAVRPLPGLVIGRVGGEMAWVCAGNRHTFIPRDLPDLTMCQADPEDCPLGPEPHVFVGPEGSGPCCCRQPWEAAL